MNTLAIEIPAEVLGPTLDQVAAKLQGYVIADDWAQVSSVPAPVENPIDIPSLKSKLASMLPQGRQLERRARKLAWKLSQGKRVTRAWDNIFLSELNQAEAHMSDDDFLALYSDEVKTHTRKGGRPRKYRSAKEQKRAHAERQRRYRERKLVMVLDVTKTPSQPTEK
jgi:hypothetical protein